MLGIFRALIVVAMLLFVFAAVYKTSAESDVSWYISAFWMLILLYIQMKRGDKTFLKICIPNYRFLNGLEYLLLSLPTICCILLNINILQALSIIVVSFLIPFIDTTLKSSRKTLNTRLQAMIPAEMFEWKAGVRTFFYAFVIVWITGFCLSFLKPAVPIAVFLIGILMFDFYQKNESFPMLLSCKTNKDKFLLHKILRHTTLFSIIIFPLIAVFIILHREIWYITVIESIVLLSIHIFSIVLKYAFYRHNQTDGSNVVMYYTGALFGLFTVTIPLLWLLSGYFYVKARKNLNFYLDDYN